MQIVYRRAAEGEFYEAAVRYEDRSLGLGDKRDPKVWQGRA